jgi:hypothetical protein
VTKLSILFASLLLALPASAQCGRCGPDGGPPDTIVGSSETLLFRSLRPEVLPDGLGTLSTLIRSHRVALDRFNTTSISTFEFVLDANLVRPINILSLELRVPSGNPISLGASPTSPITLPAGPSSLALQGPRIGLLPLSSGSYSLFARTSERPEGFALGSLADASEFVTLANPPSAAVALRTTTTRLADSSVTVADLDFQVRSTTPTTPTSLLLRLGGPAGPVAFTVPLSSSLTGRLVVDAVASPSALALAAFLLDPENLFAELRAGSTSLGAAPFRRPETLSYGVANANLDPNSPLTAGTLTLHALRSPDGDILAALASYTLAYRGFSPGITLSQLTLSTPGSPILTLAGARNGLTVNSLGSGALFQSFPLLPNDLLLDSFLNPKPVTASLNSQPALRFAYTDTIASLPAPGVAVTRIVPPISTPGSVISIFGRSFPARPLVTVGAIPGEILYAGPTQINILVPPSVPIGRTTLYVLSPDAVSNPTPIYVDVTEPFIFSDASGPAVFFTDSGLPVRPNAPAAGGSSLTVYCTGLALEPQLTYSVRIAGGVVAGRLIPERAPGMPGIWTLTFSMPTSGLLPGPQSLIVEGVFDGRPRVFPSAPVTLAVQ